MKCRNCNQSSRIKNIRKNNYCCPSCNKLFWCFPKLTITTATIWLISSVITQYSFLGTIDNKCTVCAFVLSLFVTYPIIVFVSHLGQQEESASSTGSTEEDISSISHTEQSQSDSKQSGTYHG